MTRPALAAMLLALALVGRATAQQGSPFELPTPLGGPIRSPSGQIINGLDKPPSPWDIGIGAGLSGSSGNVDIFKAVVDGDVRYDDVGNVFRGYGLYILTRSEDWTIEQKGFLTARDEISVLSWLSYYAQVQLEYDEFRTIDWRIAGHNGVSYTAFNDGSTLLKVRAGLGSARVWGDPKVQWIPEAQFGGDFEYKMTAAHPVHCGGGLLPGHRLLRQLPHSGPRFLRFQPRPGVESVPALGRDGSLRQHALLFQEERHRLLWDLDVSVLMMRGRPRGGTTERGIECLPASL